MKPVVPKFALYSLLACGLFGCANGVTTVPQAALSADAHGDSARLDPPSGSGASEVIAAPLTGSEAGGGKVIVAAEDGPAASSWLGAAAASQFVLAGGASQTLGVWIDVPKLAHAAHVPTAVALVVDTSGSMAGDKIVRAREAARTLIEKLSDGDVVSVVAFSDHARDLVAPTRLDARTRAMILGTIGELQADGATNLFDGLARAETLARMAPASHLVRRVVLISDGRATAGTIDTQAIASLAESGVAHGAQVTALGVGLDYDENALNALAVRSSGRLFHLGDPAELGGIVSSELALLQSTMATSAEVEIVPAPGVRIEGVSGALRGAWGQNGALRVKLGTMFGGQHREVVVRYRLTDGAVEGTRALATARLVFSDVLDGGVQRSQEVIVRGSLTQNAGLVAEHRDPTVQAMLANEATFALASAAREQIAGGRFDEADAQLASAESQLREAASKAKGEGERRRVLWQAERVAGTRAAAAKAAAAPAAMRPSAGRAASLMANDTSMDAAGF